MNNSILQFLYRKVALTTILAFFAITAYAQTNLISNGGFENGTTGWAVWGATLATTTDAHSGSVAAIVSNRKNPWDAINTNITSIIKSGQAYTLSAWVKIPSPAVNFRATISLNVDGVSTYHGFLWTTSPVIGSYKQYSETFTLNWTGNLVSATLYFETESVGGVYSDYIIDDVQMVEYYTIPDIIQQGAGLKDIKSSMLVGGCVTEGSKNYFTNTAAKAQVLKDCNTVTVMCYPGWGRWDEKLLHVYHVEDFTNKAREMKKQNMTVTAHMLLGWDQYFPEWYKKGDFPADTLDAIMKSWLKGIIQYKGNDTLVDIWNVVNEAINWDGKGGYWPLSAANFNNACELQRMGFEPDASGLTGKEFVNAQHPVYIRKAFEYARTLTKKKLELRDSGFEFPENGAKYNAFYQLAVHLKKMNAPVDIIGFQTHIDIEKNYDWVAYTNNIKRYVQLGYEVNIPEVDIGDVDKNWTEEKAELQKRQYYRLITAAIRGGASDFQTWGFIDDGWRPGEKAFPYTNNFEPKPAYYGIKEALIDMSSILFWEMDAPANNIMPDVMKYNHFGTMKNFGTPVIVTGFKSKALKFDGIDDYISSPVLSDSVATDFSFSCFIKTATTKAGVITDLALNENSGLKIGMNAEGKIYFDGTAAGLNENLMSVKAVNDDTWHFIAVQRDSTTYRLYIDDSAPVASKTGNIAMFSKLVVGAKPNGNEPFEGTVDEVKLYDTAIEEASFIRSFVPQGPLKLTYISSRQKISLKWSDQSTDEAGFVIERKTEDGNWSEIGKVGANILSYNNEAELYNTKYYYRVKSFSKFGKSVPSNSVLFTTPADPNTGILLNTEEKSLRVFPNPVHDSFVLVTKGNVWMKIFDIHGNLVLQKSNCSASETVDITGFSSGVYFLQACNLDKISVVKLMKN